MCFSLSFLGCEAVIEGNSEMNESSILQRVNNIEKKEDLITKSYDIKSSGINFLNLSMSDVAKTFEIECLRTISDGLYAVLKDNDGGWLYLLFNKNGDQHFVQDYWHSNGRVLKETFDSLILNQSTIDQIRSIDPYGYEMLSQETGRLPFSVHLTQDNYKVFVTYDSQLVVTQIEFIQDDEDLNRKILPFDK